MNLGADDISFLSQDQLITIQPTIRLAAIHLISGSYGPFTPPIRLRVPLWLALNLKKASKCKIDPPQWLSLDNLKNLIELDDFSSLPFNYLETGFVLLGSASDDFGNSADKITVLLREIYEIRKSRFRRKLTTLDSNHMRIEDLGAMEINEIRPFLCTSFNNLRKLQDKADEDDIV